MPHFHEVTPTQIAEPGRTTVRTIVQTVLGIVIAAGVIIPSALAILDEELGQWLSPEALAVMGTVAAASVAVSASLTRIMAIPHVNTWLARLHLDAGHGADGIPDDPRRAR